ncbi:MAG: alpha/beta hydrolase [Gammaproteobacteria bacterium]
MTRPVRPVEIEIPGPAGPIEALLEEPESVKPDAFAVICHPHPLYHGTMKNKVVHTVARAANHIERPAIRFNFRGVGRSAGQYDNGDGETADLMAVVGWGRENWPDAQLWLAGFSFGSFIALKAASAARPKRLVLIAPPVIKFAVSAQTSPQCPWMVIQGQDDELVDCDAVAEWARKQRPRPDILLMPDTDHFFHGRLRLLKEAVREFLTEGELTGGESKP